MPPCTVPCRFRNSGSARKRSTAPPFDLVDLDDLAAEHLRRRRHVREDFVLGHRGGALPLRSHASTASQFGTHEIHATNVYAIGNVTPAIISSGSSMRSVAAAECQRVVAQHPAAMHLHVAAPDREVRLRAAVEPEHGQRREPDTSDDPAELIGAKYKPASPPARTARR